MKRVRGVDLRQDRANRALPLQDGADGRLFAALDLGASKVACLIGARVTGPSGERTARVLGAAACSSRGLKGGAPSDLDAVEGCIRRAVDMAERMADLTVAEAVVTAGFKGFHARRADIVTDLGGREIDRGDMREALRRAVQNLRRDGRALIHVEPCGAALDDGEEIDDPVGLYARRLAVRAFGADLDEGTVRNLAIAAERAQLSLKRVTAAPIAAVSACLEPDEAALGTILVDMGARTTSYAYVRGGACLAAGVVPVGGEHVTQDIMIGLSLGREEAERLKVMCGAASVAPRLLLPDDLEADADLSDASVRESVLASVIGARIEETFELLDRALAKDHAPTSARVVLTGGASQLTGVCETARRILKRRVRPGAPHRPPGGPDLVRDPAFAAVVGLFFDEAARPKRRRTETAPSAAPKKDHKSMSMMRKVAETLFRGL